MMRVVVTGTQGQLARALGECSGPDLRIVRCGRPELDLLRPQSIEHTLRQLAPDIIVSAAAYTQVDLAESERELAYAINRDGTAAMARAAAALRVPIIYISTDYVFGGAKPGPYSEDDQTAPGNVYGASKLEGENAVRSALEDHVILRTAWVYSPFGRNFLKIILRLAGSQPHIRVVADQIGCPTSAADLAEGIIAVARNVLRQPGERRLFGTFHMTGGGVSASWADFAEDIMRASRRLGGPAVPIERIGSELYPTPARRPFNSCLSNDKLARVYGIALPDWQNPCHAVVRRLLAADLPIKEDVR